MHPTLFTIGKWNIPTYTVLLDLGLILALVLTYLEGRRQGTAAAAVDKANQGSDEVSLDLGLWIVIGGMIGGRLGHVLANYSLFAEDWTRAFRIWEGGLAFRGAFLGGLVMLALLIWLQGRSRGKQTSSQACRASADRRTCLSLVLMWADLVTPALALGLVFGWAACLMGGCAYGTVGEGWGRMILPDLAGIESPRFPTQAAGMLFCFLLFLVFWLMRGRWPFRGAAFLMFSMLYFGGQFFLGFARGDESAYLGPWRLGQAMDLAFALIAAAGLLVLWWRAPHGEERNPPMQEGSPSDLPISDC